MMVTLERAETAMPRPQYHPANMAPYPIPDNGARRGEILNVLKPNDAMVDSASTFIHYYRLYFDANFGPKGGFSY